MKSSLFLILFVSLFFISCEEDFDPKTDFRPKYILSCIIRGDTTYQTLTVSKSYSINGFDPYENTEDPMISSADIRLWNKDSVYFFNDTTVQRSDTSRYKTPLKYFYLNNFVPSEANNLDIRVIMDDGKTLWASTTLPSKVKWDSVTIKTLPVQGQDYFVFQWIPNVNSGWYILRYGIRYLVDDHPRIKYVPLRYNGDVPEYPKPTKLIGYHFEKAALDRAFAEISEGDPVKSRYKISGGIIELLILDEHLSKYYSSLNGFVDDFTVRVDQTDYTNVDGGLGIFGSYLKQLTGTTFHEDYVRSFGYRVNF